MLGFARIIGELVGTYAVQLAGATFAVIAASSAYQSLTAAAAPITQALN